MKKVIALMLALVMVVSLASCGGNETMSSNATETSTESETEAQITKLSLKETVVTDIVGFTIKKAKFSYYASAKSSSYAKPIKKDDGGIFKASTGRVFVCLTFQVRNYDRGNLDICNSVNNGWNLNFNLGYKGKEYKLRSYDLNNKDGESFGISLSHSAVQKLDDYEWKTHDSSNEILDPDDWIDIRMVTVAVVEPDSLDDPFEVTVNLPTSSGKDEYYTYVVK